MSCIEEKKSRCQENPVDLNFLLDGSESITQNQFRLVKDWVLKSVDEFNSSDKSPLVLTVVQFSTSPWLELGPFFVTKNSSQVKNQIDNIQQMNAGTNTYTGLNFVNTVVFPNLTKLRNDSHKILITMTDGEANRADRNYTVVREARKNFDTMVALGVGGNVVKSSLVDFSSSPNHVFLLHNFDELKKIIANITKKVCLEIPDKNDGKNLTLYSYAFDSVTIKGGQFYYF